MCVVLLSVIAFSGNEREACSSLVGWELVEVELEYLEQGWWLETGLR